MKKLVLAVAAVSMLGAAPVATYASPAEDLKAFQNYFKQRFPNVPFAEFVNGVYAIDAGSREQWEALEEFPPYEVAISEGENMFNTPFKNGQTYASCFPKGGIGVASNYPYFDTARGEVVTLELAINECRTKNGEDALAVGSSKMASMLAYMAFTTRGQTIDVKVPHDDRALKAYEAGKTAFYERRGQLNMACAHCHVDNAGNKIRADVLSPALGAVSHFPVYRTSSNAMVTLHKRYDGCHAQVRAKPFKQQGPEYRNLEYFHTYMSNGLTYNGPGVRK